MDDEKKITNDQLLFKFSNIVHKGLNTTEWAELRAVLSQRDNERDASIARQARLDELGDIMHYIDEDTAPWHEVRMRREKLLREAGNAEKEKEVSDGVTSCSPSAPEASEWINAANRFKRFVYNCPKNLDKTENLTDEMRGYRKANNVMFDEFESIFGDLFYELQNSSNAGADKEKEVAEERAILGQALSNPAYGARGSSSDTTSPIRLPFQRKTTSRRLAQR